MVTSLGSSVPISLPLVACRNAKFKLRLQLWEAGEIDELVGKHLVQQHTGPLRREEKGLAASN